MQTIEARRVDDVSGIDLERARQVISEALESSLPDVDAADRRTRSRSRTTDAILRHAWELFLTVGYEQTTIQQITEAADIGKGTFFSHFSKKSDVALYLCNHRREVILAMHRRGAFGEGSASSRIERILVTFAQLNADETPEARLMTDIVLRQFFADHALMGPRLEIEDVLDELVQLGVRNGEFAPRTDTGSAARLLHAAFYTAKASWLSTGPTVVPFKLSERVRDDVRVILRGLRP